MTIPSDYFKSPIELRTIPENQVFVQFPNGLEGNAIFNDQFSYELQLLQYNGIPIPLNERKNFGDRNFVLLNEDKFGIAFYKFYCRDHAKPEHFAWSFIK